MGSGKIATVAELNIGAPQTALNLTMFPLHYGADTIESRIYGRPALRNSRCTARNTSWNSGRRETW